MKQNKDFWLGARGGARGRRASEGYVPWNMSVDERVNVNMLVQTLIEVALQKGERREEGKKKEKRGGTKTKKATQLSGHCS